MKYKNKPVEIEAAQWFKNGDHPLDNRETFIGSDGEPFLGEGNVVRYYRHPNVPGEKMCESCGHTYHGHGFIDDSQYSVAVCPGDYIITARDGHYLPLSAQEFERTYEPVSLPASPRDA